MAKWRLGLQPIATAFVGVFLATAVAVAAETGGPIVRTTEGPVQGIVRNSIVEFLGIPYAAAPVGDLRWQPPKRHDAWTDPLRATEFELVAAWTNFMYTGNPNLKGDRPWPRCTKGSEAYLSQNVPALATITAAQFAAAHKCQFWDNVLTMRRRADPNGTVTSRAVCNASRGLTYTRAIVSKPSTAN